MDEHVLTQTRPNGHGGYYTHVEFAESFKAAVRRANDMISHGGIVGIAKTVGWMKPQPLFVDSRDKL